MSVPSMAFLVAAACYLGFQWTIRVLVYPQFRQVGRSDFAAYEREHQRRVSWCVGPLFGALVVAAVLLLAPSSGEPLQLSLGAAALTASILLVTALGAVPQHRVLSRGFDDGAHRRLLRMDNARLALAIGNVAIGLAIAAR